MLKDLKDVDYKILFELMKNARLSDRQLAKRIGVSQPTVTRRRTVLEKELIDGYSAIPKWEKLGYDVLAITLVKNKVVFTSKEHYETVRQRGIEWLMNHRNIIFGGAIEGMGINSFIMSIHRTYADYGEFLRELRIDMGSLIDDVQTLLVDLTAKARIKPLSFTYLAAVDSVNTQPKF